MPLYFDNFDNKFDELLAAREEMRVAADDDEQTTQEVLAGYRSEIAGYRSQVESLQSQLNVQEGGGVSVGGEESEG